MITEILNECERVGINLTIDQDRIRFAGPPGRMTGMLKEKISQHKERLLEYLYMKSCDEYLDEAIKELNLAGVKMREVPREVQRETLALEFEMTEAMKAHEFDVFKSLVDQWKDLFLGKYGESVINSNS